MLLTPRLLKFDEITEDVLLFQSLLEDFDLSVKSYSLEIAEKG
jgi:hypothetical protein